ncbi:MAG: GGDEF domain-containing protein [Deltaproteobacteria bacterium]|nr:GGDEF domain-containing protein [Deltaproteobacteria bacterium]
MFWRRKKSTPPPGPGAEASASDPRDLEGMAGVLRAWGRHCFDVGERTAETTAKQLEAWASHLLVLSPPPTRAIDAPPPEGRDWNALIHAMEDQRRAERAYVTSSAACVKETVVGLLRSLRATAVSTGQCDQRIRTELERLQQASANATSLDELRTSAGQVVSVVHAALEEQQRVVTAESKSLREKLATLEAQLDEVKAVATIDPLTKIGNRRRFESFMERAMLFGDPASAPMCLVMFDIDHFKTINDTYGHPAGDAVLVAVANTLVRAFPRRSDAVVRMGGEEFAVILTDTKLSDGARLARRFLESVRGLTVVHQETKITFTASGGVAELERSESLEDLVGRADAALYAAKRGGRDRIVEAPVTLGRAA